MRRYFFLFFLFLVVACSGQTKEELLQEGRQLRDQGNPRGAIVLLRNALEKDANYLEARIELAETYLATGSFEKAENEFQKVLHQNPSDSQILLKLASVYIQDEKLDDAKNTIEKFHSSNPESTESLTLLGRFYGSSGDLDSAEKLFNKVIQLDPVAVSARINLAKIYLQREDIDSARKMLNEVFENDKSNIQAYYLRANLEMRFGSREEAIKVYQDLIKVDPKELQAYYMIGMLQIDLGQIADAETTINYILKNFNDRPEGHRLKGLLLFRNSKFEEAINSFQLSLKTQRHPLTYFFLGLSHYSLNQLELGLNQFQKALDLNPTFERARILVSMTLLRQKRVDDAIIELQKILRTNSDNAYAHSLLGSAYLVQGNFDEGMAELELATEIDPSLSEAHLKRGIFHLAVGEGTEGEADLVKAVEAAPEVLNSRLMLVTYYLRQKNYTDAIESLKAGMDGSQNDALLNNYLASAYFSQKKPDLAIAALEKAKQIKPDYFTPYFNLATYYASKSEYQRALDEYQAVLKRDTKNVKALLGTAAVYILLGKDAELEGVYRQLVETEKEEGFLIAATYYIKNKDFSSAMQIVNKGVATHNTSSSLLELKGKLHQQLKQGKEAESAFISLSGLSPERGNQLLLGLYLANMQKKKAEELIAELLKSAADQDYPYLLSSGYALRQNRSEQAIRILQEGLGKVSNDLRLQMQLAHAYQTTGNSSISEQIYQKIIEKTPRYAPAYTSLGIINEQRGDKGKALELYRSALRNNSNDVAALNNLAYLLTDNFGQEEEALSLAMSAYRKQPSDPRIMDTLGYVLLKNKRFNDSLTLLTRAAEHLPDNPSVKLHLAMARLGSDQKEGVKALLGQVIKDGTEAEVKQAEAILKTL